MHYGLIFLAMYTASDIQNSIYRLDFTGEIHSG